MLRLDATTQAAYDAATTSALRAAAVVAGLSGTVSCKVCDGSDAVKGQGVMQSPWATASGDTITVGEVVSFAVTVTGTPDANWYLQFVDGSSHYVRGTFGLAGSGKEFTWSLSSWTAGSSGSIGTATLTVTGPHAPVFTVEPATASISGSGTIQFTATDVDGGTLTYSLVSAPAYYTINASTGLVTVAAGATSQTITVRATDPGGLYDEATCAVTTSDVADYPDPLLGIALAAGRTTVDVSTAAGLTSALANAVAGQTIQLAGGTYAGNFTLAKVVAADSPIIVRGAPNFASVLTGYFTFSGTNSTILDVKFDGTSTGGATGVRSSGAANANNHVLGCKFTQWGAGSTGSYGITTGPLGHGTEIAYCELYSPAGWNTTSTANGTWQARFGLRTMENGLADFHHSGWLHHCYFHDFPTKPVPGTYGSGQSDAIEIGETQSGNYNTINARWYVEHNLIERHLGRDANVDIKVGGVVLRYNTLDTAFGDQGVMAFRGGSFYAGTMESNWVGPDSGLSLHGGYHRVAGNRVRGSQGIWLNTGDVEYDQATTGHACGAYCTLAGNDSTLVLVGKYSYGEFLAHHNRIEANTGTVTLGNQSNTVQSATTSLHFALGTKLTTADVGPDAMSGASATWRAARIP